MVQHCSWRRSNSYSRWFEPRHRAVEFNGSWSAGTPTGRLAHSFGVVLPTIASADLEEAVAALQKEISELRQQMAEFRKQFE